MSAAMESATRRRTGRGVAHSLCKVVRIGATDRTAVIGRRKPRRGDPKRSDLSAIGGGGDETAVTDIAGWVAEDLRMKE